MVGFDCFDKFTCGLNMYRGSTDACEQNLKQSVDITWMTAISWPHPRRLKRHRVNPIHIERRLAVRQESQWVRRILSSPLAQVQNLFWLLGEPELKRQTHKRRFQIPCWNQQLNPLLHSRKCKISFIEFFHLAGPRKSLLSFLVFQGACRSYWPSLTNPFPVIRSHTKTVKVICNANRFGFQSRRILHGFFVPFTLNRARTSEETSDVNLLFDEKMLGYAGVVQLAGDRIETKSQTGLKNGRKLAIPFLNCGFRVWNVFLHQDPPNLTITHWHTVFGGIWGCSSAMLRRCSQKQTWPQSNRFSFGHMTVPAFATPVSVQDMCQNCNNYVAHIIISHHIPTYI